MSKILKKIFDFVFSVLLFLVLLPLILVLVILSTISTNKFGIFSQTRVGKNAKVFRIYKIRSMIVQKGDVITVVNDPRITRFGAFIRKYKLDEITQLYNIIIGDMSFVGPRPDVPGYADKLKGDDRIILSVKPGVTGAATIHYRDEEILLSEVEDIKEYNDNVIWPDKVKINKDYITNWTLYNDFIILLKTVNLL